MVQLDVNANEAKVFKTHAAHLGLCDNVTNAQKDGDRPIQSKVTGLHERNRRGIMDGLGSFIRADNRGAVGLGHLRQGTRPLHVPKLVRLTQRRPSGERTDEVTLRAEEVKTLKACTWSSKDGDRRWLILAPSAETWVFV